MARVEEFYPSALTVAGSDSGGGAGIQADLRTFSTFGVYGCSAITAVTSQNPFAVTRIDYLPGAAVTAQIDAVTSRFALRAVKTGMQGTAEAVAATAAALAKISCVKIIDPVMVATSGARLLQEDAVAAVLDKLLPVADWVTPNLPEAEILSGRKIRSLAEMAEAGRACADRWHCSFIVKGGHLAAADGVMTDVVIHDGKTLALTSPVLEGSLATHGTGCTFSAALAAAFAVGQSWKEALKTAKAFVYGSLIEEVELGEDLHAMYPPIESYLAEIALKRID